MCGSKFLVEFEHPLNDAPVVAEDHDTYTVYIDVQLTLVAGDQEHQFKGGCPPRSC